MAAELQIISSMTTRELLADMLASYAQVSMQPVRATAIGGVDATRRVQAGEAFDVVVLARRTIEQLIGSKHVVAGSRVDLVHSGVAVAVRAGAKRPDMGSEAALRQTVLAARSIGYSTGPSGLHLASLFERWGIADEVRSRIVQAPPGVAVAALMVRGEVELGFQQWAELMHHGGIEILGPLPAATQIITTFSAGLAATSVQAAKVRAMLKFMASPATHEAKRRNGMEPA